MEWVIVETRWIEARGRIKQEWCELTDDHLDTIAGKREMLVSTIQENFGVSAQNANEQVTNWESRNRDLFAETAEQIKPYLGIAKQ